MSELRCVLNLTCIFIQRHKKTDSVPYIYCYIFYTKVTLLKDARSVSLYSYNQSQILQNVKYTKLINIAKGFAKFVKK